VGGAVTRPADLTAERQTRLEELTANSERHIAPISTWAREGGIKHDRVPCNVFQ
jgi:hypothetical protein